jgi:uncharacterized protein GlcG (DUF336 family)
MVWIKSVRSAIYKPSSSRAFYIAANRLVESKSTDQLSDAIGVSGGMGKQDQAVAGMEAF